VSGVSRLAKECNQHDRANEVLQPSYESSRAMLKVNGMWIASNLKEQVLYATNQQSRGIITNNVTGKRGHLTYCIGKQ
jgi:hypothetical protein